jgi:hemin uptake protein HemP
MHVENSHATAPGSHPAASTATIVPAVRRLSSASLMQNEREVEIEHGNKIYRLRVTQLGKLILTA